jgi:hypothetical protein
VAKIPLDRLVGAVGVTGKDLNPFSITRVETALTSAGSAADLEGADGSRPR